MVLFENGYVQRGSVPFQVPQSDFFQNYNNINILYVIIYKFIKILIYHHLFMYSKKTEGNQINQMTNINFFARKNKLGLLQFEPASYGPDSRRWDWNWTPLIGGFSPVQESKPFDLSKLDRGRP